jgi:ABC-2 type transport system permease protein
MAEARTIAIVPSPPRARAEASPFLRLFAQMKWRLANNYLAGLRSHLWVHFALAMFVLLLLIGGGTMLFKFIFDFLMRQEPFGPPLMDRLIRMVLLAFFSMLVFSNFIIMLTTTYFSREVEFLMSQPIGHRRLFFGKLFESMIYSSWAFVILAFPFFFALGQARHLGLMFYLGAIMLLLPYLIIPGALGSLLALIMTAWFPPRKLIRYALALLVIGFVSALITQRIYGLRHLLMGGGGNELANMMRFMGVGDFLAFPSGWVGRGLLALELAQPREALFWAAMLWSTALMGLVACDWLAGPLYYQGWANTRTSGSAQRHRRGGLFLLFDRLLCWLPASTRTMVTKDLTVFWRDPGQWGQLMILFGLLFIYILNLRSAAGMGRLQIFTALWQSLISLFNIGATTFVLSILTTRFVYPMLSLEGKQQWVIGLAPVARTRLVWVKFALSTFGSVVITLPLALLSCAMLKAGLAIVGLTIMNIFILALGLSSLAVGLGAMLPNFNEDNPSRIANGFGGTLNAVISLVYIGLTLVLEGPWVMAYVQHAIPAVGMAHFFFWASLPAWSCLQLVMIITPLAMGLRRWRRMEF